MVLIAYLSHPHSFRGPESTHDLVTMVKVTSRLRTIVYEQNVKQPAREFFSIVNETITCKWLCFDQRERGLCRATLVHGNIFVCLLRIFRLCGDVSFVSEGLQCLLHTACEQGGVLSCCCDTGPRFLRTHLNDRSISRFVQQATITANYSKPDTHCPMQRTVPFSCLLHQITTRNGKCICVTIQVLRLFL